MTSRPQAAPAAIAATPVALRAPAVATTAAASSPPGDQTQSTPTTTDEKWGQIRPSRWGQPKSSFSVSNITGRWTYIPLRGISRNGICARGGPSPQQRRPVPTATRNWLQSRCPRSRHLSEWAIYVLPSPWLASLAGWSRRSGIRRPGVTTRATGTSCWRGSLTTRRACGTWSGCAGARGSYAASAARSAASGSRWPTGCVAARPAAARPR